MRQLFLIIWSATLALACNDANLDQTETSTDSAGAFIRCHDNFDCPEKIPFCAENRCVACLADSDCKLGHLCRAGMCTPCSTADSCGESCVACPDHLPVCNDQATGCGICNEQAPCEDGYFCDEGECLLCAVNEFCGPLCETCSGFTPYCDDTGARCAECNAEHLCDEDLWCNDGNCTPCDEGLWSDKGTCTLCDEADHCGSACLKCTGTNTPLCSLERDECVECLQDDHCGGFPAVCSPDGTCTCENATADPKGQCTSDADCSGPGLICARDFPFRGSGPTHFTCLHTCGPPTTNNSGLSCGTRPGTDMEFARVWVPPTSCHAYAAHLLELPCTYENQNEVCSSLSSWFTDATCSDLNTCSYP